MICISNNQQSKVKMFDDQTGIMYTLAADPQKFPSLMIETNGGKTHIIIAAEAVAFLQQLAYVAARNTVIGADGKPKAVGLMIRGLFSAAIGGSPWVRATESTPPRPNPNFKPISSAFLMRSDPNCGIIDPTLLP